MSKASSIIIFVARLLSALSPMQITLFTWLRRRRRVGCDPLGNTYYESRARPTYTHTRRWVIYKGFPDPSTLPPCWHGWLHHQIDVFPKEEDVLFVTADPDFLKIHTSVPYRAWSPPL